MKKLISPWTPALARALARARTHLALPTDGATIAALLLAWAPSDLSAARKRAGLSQSALAALCGVRRSTVSNVEQGRWKPSGKLAKWLAEQG